MNLNSSFTERASRPRAGRYRLLAVRTAKMYPEIEFLDRKTKMKKHDIYSIAASIRQKRRNDMNEKTQAEESGVTNGWKAFVRARLEENEMWDRSVDFEIVKAGSTKYPDVNLAEFLESIGNMKREIWPSYGQSFEQGIPSLEGTPFDPKYLEATKSQGKQKGANHEPLNSDSNQK